MLDHMAQKTCPHCGASIDAGRTVCPNCRTVLKKKNPLTPYLVIAGLAVIVVVIVAFVLTSPVPDPGTTIDTGASIPPTGVVAAAPTQPTCTIAITGSKAASSIRLQVMTSTCSAGDVTDLRVSVNGVQAGTLGTGAGASGTFPAPSGSNTVIVVAKFASGAEKVMYQNAAL
jgi:predicted nucleic acid-binding Zn ribbon protein